MPSNPSKLSQFWQELKRRKVTRVVTIYAATAFAILELNDIVAPSLGLPEWTLNLIIILLSIGLVLTVILSWIFDVTPEGIERTKPVEETPGVDHKSVSVGWKIATYVSVIIIVGLLVLNILGRGDAGKIDESLDNTIAILPVRNLRGDPGQEPMCAGLTTEIINQLAKIKSFDKVVPFQTVWNYKDSEKSTPQIAEEIDVNYILKSPRR